MGFSQKTFAVVASILGMILGNIPANQPMTVADDTDSYYVADDGIGTYVGGNMRSTTYEYEGLTVVQGDAALPAGGFQRDGGSLGGFVQWGLGYSGLADSDMLNVGGNLTASVPSSNWNDSSKYFSAAAPSKSEAPSKQGMRC